MKKKICFYVNSIYTLGGIQRIISEMANILINYYDITIICEHKTKEKDRVDYNLNSNIKVKVIDNDYIISEKIIFFPIRIIKFFIRKFRLDKYKFGNRLLKIDYRIFRKKRVIKFLNEEKFDYILAEGLYYCIYFSKLKPYINTYVIGCWHSSYENYISDYEKSEIEKSLKILDKTIVLTKHDMHAIETQFNIKVKYIYNFINDDIIKSPTLKNKIFLSVGRYDKIKGYNRLIKIFNNFYKYNKEWKLLLVGEGSERKNLQILINKYKLDKNVILVGKTSDVNKYYEEASIYLMSSYGEGFPMTILEAMKHKLPIIAYDIPVLHELLPNNQYIVEQDNDALFLNYMMELSSNITKRLLVGRKNEEYVKKFSNNNIIKEWMSILK